MNKKIPEQFKTYTDWKKQSREFVDKENGIIISFEKIEPEQFGQSTYKYKVKKTKNQKQIYERVFTDKKEATQQIMGLMKTTSE